MADISAAKDRSRAGRRLGQIWVAGFYLAKGKEVMQGKSLNTARIARRDFATRRTIKPKYRRT